jgi:hypothetical protein
MNDDTLFDGPLRFEVSPAFDPKFACTLIPYGEPLDGYGLRCEFRGYVEEADSWETPVPRDIAEQLLSDLAAVRISPIPDFNMGLDGMTSVLALGHAWGSIVLRWWGPPPSQWKGLVPILRRLLTLAGPRAAGVEIE